MKVHRLQQYQKNHQNIVLHPFPSIELHHYPLLSVLQPEKSYYKPFLNSLNILSFCN